MKINWQILILGGLSMKRFRLSVLLFALMILVTGCVYDQPTLDYAKKHKLNEKIYENSKIICIAPKEFNKAKLVQSLHTATKIQKKQFITNLCNRNKNTMRALHRNYDYAACVKKLTYYFRADAIQDKKREELIHIKGVHVNIMKYENYIDVYVDKNIISYHPFSTEYGFDPYAKKAFVNGVSNYITNENFSCKTLNK